MGWTGLNHEIDDPIAFFKSEWKSDTCEVLDGARVGSTVYLAVQRRPEGAPPYVFAVVCLTSNRGGFCYKDMDEAMGPYECDCPDRIMRLLSPIEALGPDAAGYAQDWRNRVAGRKLERKAQGEKMARLQVGATVTLPGDVTFSTREGKITAREFRVTFKAGRDYVLEPVNRPGFRCKLTRATFANATIA